MYGQSKMEAMRRVEKGNKEINRCLNIVMKNSLCKMIFTERKIKQ